MQCPWVSKVWHLRAEMIGILWLGNGQESGKTQVNLQGPLQGSRLEQARTSFAALAPAGQRSSILAFSAESSSNPGTELGTGCWNRGPYNLES